MKSLSKLVEKNNPDSGRTDEKCSYKNVNNGMFTTHIITIVAFLHSGHVRSGFMSLFCLSGPIYWASYPSCHFEMPAVCNEILAATTPWVTSWLFNCIIKVFSATRQSIPFLVTPHLRLLNQHITRRRNCYDIYVGCHLRATLILVLTSMHCAVLYVWTQYHAENHDDR